MPNELFSHLLTMTIPCVRRQRQQQIHMKYSSFVGTKRSYATSAIICSMLGVTHIPVIAMKSLNARNRTTNTSTTSSFLSDSTLFEDFEHRISNNMSSNLIWHHLTEPIGSTQDEAYELLKRHPYTDKALAVLADIQLDGRGTQGRKWERGGTLSSFDNDGNLYLTVCIPFNRIPSTVTLLPLQIGVLVAERVSQLISSCRKNNMINDNSDVTSPKVTVKWPNDVLVDHRKISGTLIETKSISLDESAYPTTWMLIGIGMNVASVPRNLLTLNRPGKHIREPCCIQEFCSPSVTLPIRTAIVIGHDIATAVADWVFQETNLSKQEYDNYILHRWKSYAEFGMQYELRGHVVDEEHGGYEGERVTTINIEYDGQLRVRGANGVERLLVADYLF